MTGTIKREKCRGCIVLEDKKVLIIGSRDENGKMYWSFPKGHQEDGETDIETAMRETKEEEVLLYIAKPLNDEIKVQKDEVEEAIWIDVDAGGKYFDEYYNDVWEEFLKRFKKYTD